MNRGAVVLPLSCCAACPGFLARGRGSGWPWGRAGADRFRAGQAAAGAALAPGEVISADALNTLQVALADGGRIAYAADPTLTTIQVTAR